MAVQQNKKSPSKRGMHRSHNALSQPGTAKVRPVPIRRVHLGERLLQEPRPDAVGLARRVGVLEREYFRYNGCCLAFSA